MFRYSPYWVKPIVQDPPPTPFGGALVWLDYGYFRPDETNKLCSIEPNELGIDQRVMIKGIESSVDLKGSSTYTAKIIHDYNNDNILVLGANGLSSFDPRSLTLNWNVPLADGQYNFCGSTVLSSAISKSYVWVISTSAFKLRAYDLLDGSLIYDLPIGGTHNVVGGTVPIGLPISGSNILPVADDMVVAGYDYLDAHNGGSAKPYQVYRLTPTSATTFTLEALPGLPGTATQDVGGFQTFPLPGYEYEVFIFPSSTVNGQTAIGTFNMQTGIWTPRMTASSTERWGLLYLQLDCIDVSANKAWISGSRTTDSGGTEYGLFEFTYPGFELLGKYGGRLQQSGNNVSTTVYQGPGYYFYVIGSYIYAVDGVGSAKALYIWDVGDYNNEPTKILPLCEGTRVQTYYNATYASGTISTPYPEEYVLPMNIYFPKVPPLHVAGSQSLAAGFSNLLALRPTSKIITQSLPGLSVPAVAATVSTANPVATVTMWQKVTWIRVELDGINTTELQVVNDGLNETTYGWLYDETGKQVTYNKAFPLVLGDMIEAGAYYLALVNVKGDTTSLIAPSNHNFRVTITNSPDVVQHDLTVRLATNYK